MVSVIIPVYNVCDYIDACVESVVEQTWSEFEVILIDDGSTDGSDRKCREWQELDPRIRLIRKENEGLGPSRNLGVKLARYEYITFLDSDDWWDSHYLEEMLRPVRKAAPDIVCCDIHYWERDEGGKAKDSVSELRMEADRALPVCENRELINTARTFMWGKLYKKTLFTENQIVAPAYVYEDVAVTPIAIASAASLYRVGLPLYYYRKRSGSLANSAAGLWDMNLSLRDLMAGFEKRGLLEPYRKQLKKLFYSQVRFVVKKARALCDERVSGEIEDVYFRALVRCFPETGKVCKGIFIVEGKTELRAALQLIVMDERQIVDCREAKGQGAALQDRISFLLEIPGAGTVWMISPSGEGQECRKAQIDIPFSIEGADEGQLWNLADKIFYELSGIPVRGC